MSAVCAGGSPHGPRHLPRVVDLFRQCVDQQARFLPSGSSQFGSAVHCGGTSSLTAEHILQDCQTGRVDGERPPTAEGQIGGCSDRPPAAPPVPFGLRLVAALPFGPRAEEGCGREVAREEFNHGPTRAHRQQSPGLSCTLTCCPGTSRCRGTGRWAFCMPPHCLSLLVSTPVLFGQQSTLSPPSHRHRHHHTTFTSTTTTSTQCVAPPVPDTTTRELSSFSWVG